MQIAQAVFRASGDSSRELAMLAKQMAQPDLVLVFGSIERLKSLAAALAEVFPLARRIGCSTAGEISTEGVTDDCCVLTVVRFEKISLTEVSTQLARMEDSLAAGRRLAELVPKVGLRAVLLFGQGILINGSALLAGVTEILGDEVPVTGGLAGDGGAFRQTWVLDEHGLGDRTIVALGLYGEGLVFRHGSYGGWSPFGPARKVTRCDGNVLYELDGEAALDIYKRYLGSYAKDLPASGLLFPFSMLGRDHNAIGLIRTIMAVDERDGSLTLAGEVDPDGYLKLMHASTDALVNGAEMAAEAAHTMSGSVGGNGGEGKRLALLVSCVGRKLVMGERVEEEVEAVCDVFGQNTVCAGFYSYGEISPFCPGVECKLHNQTMTVTIIGEA